ncbi:MAG: DUF192 domain-containing protein [Candidatus Moranbacteria bacterium]|nr:DUF192 domain-containing protein [Candidatus Moranbacteria bacterium]
MKKVFDFRYVMLLLIIICGAYFLVSNNFFRNSVRGNSIERVVIDEAVFRVETVSDEQKLQKGLGKRKWMCSNCGMIFRFQESKKHAFWMKDMRFPLDIIWISDGKIVWIEKNVSHENQQKIYNPFVDTDSVLELRSGSCDEHEIEVGDYVRAESANWWRDLR